MSKKNLTCCECGKPAEWMRYTQFSGNHPYCTECAKKEKDFPEGDGSYSDWDTWPPEEKTAPVVPNRLYQIRKEILNIREKADAEIALLKKESERLFEKSLTFGEIPVGQRFLYDLYGPVCKKTEQPQDAVIENNQNKGLRIRLKTSAKVFLLD